MHDAGAPFVWTMVPGPDESIVRRHRQRRQGRARRSQRQRQRCSSTAARWRSTRSRRRPNGGLYVGTSPDGRIYSVDAKGQATPFFDPDDKYIWALAVDAKGVVYAATGDKGVVYRITPDGKGAPFFTTKTTHAIVARVRRRADSCWSAPARRAASSASTRRARASCCSTRPTRKSRRCASIRRASSTSRRRAASRRRVATTRQFTTDRPTPPPAAPVPSGLHRDHVDCDHRRAGDAAARASGGRRRGDRRGPTGAVYRVLPDGLWDELWESRDDAPYDVAIEPDGSPARRDRRQRQDLPARRRPDAADAADARRRAAGHDAAAHADSHADHHGESRRHLVAISSEPRRERHLRVRRQGRTHGRDLGRGVAGVRRRPPARASRCARARATRGRRTRRGATGRRPTPTPNGSPITSPKARYLQWRAVLSAARATSPVLTSVERGLSAAQRAARGDARSPCTRPASSSRSRSRPARPRLPASTTTPSSGGWPTPATPARRRAPPRSDAARIRRGCRRSCGRPRTRTATS